MIANKSIFRIFSVLLIIVLILVGTPLQAARTAGVVLYAKPSATGIGDCLSWENACTLQTALTGATSGEEIWAAAGTYKPTTGTDRNATFQLKNGVAVYGGFAGTETARNQRNPMINVTVLSGDIDGDDSQTPIITDLATVTGNTTNSYHVVKGVNNATLDGFTVTAGNAGDAGGGMYNVSSNPTVTNVTFRGNSASSHGGGMYNSGSSPAVTNVAFSGNSANHGGGMVNISSSSPTLTNVTFTDNSATSYGGGMYNSGSNPTLTNVTFGGNSATSYGGGMFNSYSSSTIHNTIFWGNLAPNGAQINLDNSSANVSDSVVEGGYAGGSNILTGNPNLGALGNYGGFVQTVPILAGSSAIDTGNDATCAATDQRGTTRPQGAHCDIGAFEYTGIDYVSVRYAKPATSGTGDCSSWENACTLQTALTGSAFGYDIWVMTGADKPTTVTTNRSATFQLKTGVAVYGGFAGTETARNQRNPMINVTVLSGDIDGDDSQTPIITDLATVTGNTTNSYHVVKGVNNATLDGFTVTAGNAGDAGGGMYNVSSNPTVTNVTFRGNSASSHGGGMYNSGSSPAVTNVAFSGNSANHGGGMVNISSSSPTLTNVTFTDNSATSYGGGMYNSGSNPTLTNVTFGGNSATSYGGGMFNSYSSSTIHNTIFWGNLAPNGAQINLDNSSANVSDSVVEGGYAGGSNILTGNPNLGALGNYGGFVQTVPILAGSSAIDTGNDATCAATDQRGTTRPQGAHCDIGAFEYTGIDYVSVRYAKPATSGTGDCSSWENACTLQTALTGSAFGYDIWVMTGAHKPTTVTTNRSATFQLKTGVAVYGGFAGTETARNQRNPMINVTVLSGDIDGDDSQTPIITDLATVTGNTTNSYHVVKGVNNATLDGFTVTAGNAGDAGGGMYNVSSNPTVTNVTFRGNSASSHGGGMYNSGSSPAVTNVAFSGNSANHGGGMVNISSSSPTLTNVTFTDNSAASYGGGMYNSGSNPTLTNVTFGGNSATSYGGGMFNSYSSSTIHNTIFWGNLAPNGAQINLDNSSANVSDSVVEGGYAGGSNILTGNPNLGALGNYGGFVQTVPILAGSSAIDTGNDATCAATDQRGITRPQGAHCDIGAFEQDDFTAPTVNTFTATTPSNHLNIPITAFTATDAIGVTGYLITESATVPASGAAGWTGTAPTTYTVLSGGSYTLYPWAMDAAGNISAAFASPRAVVVDTTAPTVDSITLANISPTSAASVDFTVTFSESVTGVDADDFDLATTGVIGASITGVSGSGNVYTVTVSTGSNNGTIRLDVPIGATITDLAGNPLASLPFTGGETYIVTKGYKIYLPLVLRN